MDVAGKHVVETKNISKMSPATKSLKEMSNFSNFLEGANPVSPLGSSPSSVVEFVGPEYTSMNQSKPMTKAQLKYFPEQQQLTSHEKRFQDPEQQQLCGHEKRNQKKFKNDYSPHSVQSIFSSTLRPGELTPKNESRLFSPPILTQANENLPFIIKCDASGFALGAVLIQGEGADEHPIEYASRLLSNAEQNYSTIEREPLAIVWAVQKYRGYINGTEVKIVTDHQPLKWLMSLKSPSGRLARWALLLQPYNIKIDYKPGKVNVVADTLSRPPIDAEQIQITSFDIEIPRKGAKEIREGQLGDPDLNKIISCFESNYIFRIMHWTKRGFMLNDGILYCYHDFDFDNAQLVIPKN